MSQSLHHLMDAYLDGELPEIQVIEFELHLEDCEICHSEFEQQKMLRQALFSLRPVQGEKNPRQFLTAIMMQIDRNPQPKMQVDLKGLLWYLVPVGLILFLGLLRFFSWITGLFDLFPGLSQFVLDALPFLSLGADVHPLIPTALEAVFIWAGFDWLLFWNILSQVILLGIAMIAYCTWMGLWYFNHRPRVNLF